MQTASNKETIPHSGIRLASIRFSLPIMAEFLLMSLIAMVNLSLVGHLGPGALSAVGLSSQPVAISLALFQSISIGVSALVARSVGARNFVEAQMAVYQSLYIAVASGAVIGIVSFIFAEQIVIGMGAQSDTLESAVIYMRFMAAGMIFQAIPTAVTSILRGAGDATSPMWYNIITNIVNALFGFLLIHGLLFIPAMGITGAGLATTLAKIVNTFLAMYALYRSPLPIRLKLARLPRPDFSIMKRIMAVGSSAAAESMAMRAGFVFYSRIIADLGTLQFAAHQIILSATQFGSNAMKGLSAASSSFTGRSLGEENPSLARKYNRSLMEIGLLISICSGILFFGWGELVARIFTDDREVIRLTGSVLKIAAVITIPQSFLSILSGALRGAGDTRWTMYSAFAGMIVARVGLSYILVIRMNLGLEGAWIAALADQGIRAVFVTARYLRGKWIYLKV
ncbi:MATE family efflux transporter [Spirochaeta dissipatitropha]